MRSRINIIIFSCHPIDEDGDVAARVSWPPPPPPRGKPDPRLLRADYTAAINQNTH